MPLRTVKLEDQPMGGMTEETYQARMKKRGVAEILARAEKPQE
jgi:hypothetical protein